MVMTTNDKRSKWCRDWAAGLPNGLLDMIVEWLPVTDCVAFGKACKSWKKVVMEASSSSTTNAPPRGCPCLVTNASGVLSFRSIIECKTRRMKFESKTHSEYLYGAFQDWLVIWTLFPINNVLDHYGPPLQRLFLMNPFTGDEINMPILQEAGDKIVLSGSPSEQNCNFVCLLFQISSFKFSLWSKGDKTWTQFVCRYEQEPEPLKDAVACNGHFYILTRNYNIILVNTSYGSSTIKTQFYHIEMPELPEGYIFRYMIEHCGDIILVLRFFTDIDINSYYINTDAFKIYKLDFERRMWVRLYDLGDRIVFLGMNSSQMHSAKELKIERSNCIYYTNDSKQFPIVDEDIYYISEQSIDFEDWGIYSLEEKFFDKKFYHPSEKANENTVWLFAPLSWYLLGE